MVIKMTGRIGNLKERELLTIISCGPVLKLLEQQINVLRIDHMNNI